MLSVFSLLVFMIKVSFFFNISSSFAVFLLMVSSQHMQEDFDIMGKKRG